MAGERAEHIAGLIKPLLAGDQGRLAAQGTDGGAAADPHAAAHGRSGNPRSEA
jgi:hypothetical protein